MPLMHKFNDDVVYVSLPDAVINNGSTEHVWMEEQEAQWL